MNEYENEQLQAIIAWKKEEPGVISKAFGTVMKPVTWLIQKIIPQSAFKGLIDGANSTAEMLTDKDDIIKTANDILSGNSTFNIISDIRDLRHKNLNLSDDLANEIHNWAIGMATAEGAATGATGIFGLSADIPIIITLALRTIHKIGLCYGYECVNEIDKQFVLIILAASSSNSIAEKTTSLIMLREIQVLISKQTWKSLVEKATQQQFSKEWAIIGLKNLAKQLGVNLTKRKALQAIPVVGAMVGGSVNGWYIKDVGWAARHMFQERWLLDNHPDDDHLKN
ncbi:conserved hypothetical protein [Beggiatoa sp. PS]|nr:conserved hypothetical protein [Beggiatoa sp. PS]